MVAGTCLSVTLYVPCRSCYNLDVVCSLHDTNLVFSKTLHMTLEGLIELPLVGLQCDWHFGPYRFHRKTQLIFFLMIINPWNCGSSHVGGVQILFESVLDAIYF